MTLSNRTTDELVRIAHAGGGFRLDTSGRPTEDLVRIAAATRTNKATVIFAGMGMRSTDDLMKIGSAGKGCVIFED
jgi:hypothetical protein